MAFSLFQIIKGLLISEENTLTPKQIEITPGGTAGTKTTVVSSQTTNKTVTLPDATDTLVGKATTDTLTNKAINAANNTITNISDTEIKSGAGIDASKIANGSVSNAEFQALDGVTSPIQTQITTNATNISNHISNPTGAHAASAISNTPTGNLAASDVQGALNELQTDIDTRATASALSTHTGATTGVHGVTGTVVGTTDTQTLTNKTLTNPVIAQITSGAGVSTLPTATGTLLSTAAAVTIAQGGTGANSKSTAFDALSPNTTKGDITVHNGTTNVRLAVGVDGTFLKADSSAPSGISFGTSTGNLVVASKTSNYTLTSGDDLVTGSASGGAFTFTLPTAVGITGKRFILKKTDSSTNIITINTTSSQTIDGVTSKKLNTQNESIEVISDGANWIILDRRIPTEWVSYTPTASGFWTGANVTYTGAYRRVGDTMEVYIRIVLGGAPPSVSLSGITIPNSSVWTIDTTKLIGGQNTITPLGQARMFDLSGGAASGTYSGNVTYGSTTTVRVLALPNSTTSHYDDAVTQAVPFTFASGDEIQLSFKIPITNWEG